MFQIESVTHYQAISHTDKSNLKFTVFLPVLDLKIYVK